MKIVNAEQMRFIDRKTIDEFGISGLILMERAGLAVVRRIKELYSQKKIIVVSGSGNNGGDGLVIARNLHNEGWDVKVFLLSKPDDLKGDALVQYKAAIQFGVDIKRAEELLRPQSTIFTRHALIIDAVLGTGLNKDVSGRISEIINLLNASKLTVIAVDIPTGISSDNGQIMGNAVRANYTVTFGLPKRGHFLYPGAEYSGTLFVEDIGFPGDLLSSEGINVDLLEKDHIFSLIPERRRYSHKGDYGHVLVVAGSRGKTGAAFMAAKACLRTGTGLVTIGIPESLADIFQSRVTEEMILILPDRGNGTLHAKAADKILAFLREKADILAIGPGIGTSVDTQKLLKSVIVNASTPVVIDADGLNSVQGEKKIFKKAKVPLILTPHPGEMARLISKEQRAKSKNAAAAPNAVSLRDQIEKNRIDTAVSFSEKTGVYLVLKGVPTIISTPDGRAFVNSTGNPGMATAGAGDVLTGMISGFLSQGASPLNACNLGVYVHGLAGDIASAEKGEHPMIASDIIDAIPKSFKSIKS